VFEFASGSKEKMLLLKEEVIKDRGSLPKWFKY